MSSSNSKNNVSLRDVLDEALTAEFMRRVLHTMNEQQDGTLDVVAQIGGGDWRFKVSLAGVTLAEMAAAA